MTAAKDANDVTTRGIIFPFAIAMSCIILLMISALIYSSNVLNTNMQRTQLELIDNALSSELAKTLDETKSVAWWDETVIASQPSTFDLSFIEIEIDAYLTESYGHHDVIIYNRDDMPVFAYSNGKKPTPAALNTMSEAVKPAIDAIRRGQHGSPRLTADRFGPSSGNDNVRLDWKLGKWAGLVTKIDSQPVFVSALTIVPTVDSSLYDDRNTRILVSIKKIDAALIGSISSNTLSKDLVFGHSPDDSRNSSIALNDDFGHQLGFLSWNSPRPGDRMKRNVLPPLLVGLIVASIFVVMLFTRLIRASRILRAQKSEAQYMANHDMLTGLPNRRVLSMRLDAGSANHAADDHRIILATLDLDRFKEINDTLGHHAGDELLAGVAMRLRSTLPPSDLLVRLGGDEFAVLCDDGSETSETDLGALIQAALRKPLSLGGHQIDVQISVGIASAKTPQGYAQLMQSSDIALYDAKSRGPGQIGYFVPSMAQRLDDRRAMKVEMRKAFTNGEFILHYQPIVEASTGKVAAVEALLRWSNEKFGQVSPEIFVPLAEECGMMAALGQFVIDRAVADSRSWPNFKTAINISPAQIRSVSIVSDIIRSIKRHKVDPRNIIVEVTETALLGNDRRTLKKLNMLKDRGFGLALDDFGTGYSSLAYIRDFPFDRLKIDKSFIRSSENSPRSLEIIQGIVNFGKILGREVVAEGIETETQMQTMQRAGVTHLQGFLFAKALDATTIEVLAAAGGVIPSRRTTRLELGDREPTKAPPIALPAPRQMPRS